MRLVFGALVLVSAIGPARAEPRAPVLHVAPSMTKVRPDVPLPAEAMAGGSVLLDAARGECEAFHLVASAGTRPLLRLEVRAPGPLVRAGGGQLRAALYREAFVDVKKPSNVEGAVGPWPDALVPVADAQTGEPRRAFPVDVPAHRHQPVYVEVCVPGDAAPGAYDGELLVRVHDRAAGRVRMRVQVHRAVVPATSSLPVTFGVSGKSLLYGHFGEKRDDEARRAIVRSYALDALRHRVSLHGMSRIPPMVREDKDGLRVDFGAWDEEIAPLLDGGALPGGARFTSIDLRTPDGLTGTALRDYYRAVEKHFRERGWLDRLFAYVMDEPKPAQTAELVSRLAALQAAPGIRRLVTVPLRTDLAGLVDIWTPNLNCLFVKERPREFCALQTPREDYRAREEKGERLWWYQSCSSHGCRGPMGDARDRYFTGWPSYVIDADGASARVMGWLAFANDIGGELYFDTAHAYNFRAPGAEARDPWDDQYAFGGNGDGTLFYPGRPDRIGGTTHVPVASLRLKLVRDGLEDYELLRLLAARDAAGARRARELARRMAPQPFRFERSPAAFAAARREMLEALDSDAEPRTRPASGRRSTGSP